MKIDYLEMVENCISYIETNLNNKISIEDVLEKTYYSYPHFHRIFMDIVGESITSYVRKRKLSSAAIELASGQKPIINIALDYHFSSQQTFNRAFTNYFGISPLKYRETGMMDDLYKPFTNNIRQSKALSPDSVLIEKLPPMTVASFHSYTDKVSPKNAYQEEDKIIAKAWGNLVRWQMAYEYQKVNGIQKKLPGTLKIAGFMTDNRLHLPPNTRYFGFINPFPFAVSEFGYEVWAMLKDVSESTLIMVQNPQIEIKDFSGGLYATAEATYGPDSNLDEMWKNLHHWLSQNEQYEYGDHQWLEEHITKAGAGGFHGFKLFMAIKPT